MSKVISKEKQDIITRSLLTPISLKQKEIEIKLGELLNEFHLSLIPKAVLDF